MDRFVEGKSNPQSDSTPLSITKAERVREKVVDLSKDREHFLHFVPPGLFPLITILRDGIVSHRYAEETLGIQLAEGFEPVVQSIDHQRGDQAEGFNLVSLHDPRKHTSVLSLLTDRIGHQSELAFLISPNVDKRVSNKRKLLQEHTESFIVGNIEAQEIMGIIVDSKILNQSGVAFLDTPQTDTAGEGRTQQQRKLEGLRMHFLRRPFRDTQLEQLRMSFLQAQTDLEESLAWIAGFDSTRRPISFSQMWNRIPPKLRYGMEVGVSISGSNSTDRQEFFRIFFHDDEAIKYAEKEAERIRGVIERVKTKDANTEQKVPEIPEPAMRISKFEKRLEYVQKLINARKERARIDKEIWPLYIEKTAEKAIDQATVKDFLVGVCKEQGIPLYVIEDGHVVWPEAQAA